MKRVFLGIALILLFFVLATAGGLAWYGHKFMNTAPETPGRDLVIEIKPGSSLDAIASQLAEQNIITNPLAFKVLAMYRGQGTRLQAGRFLVNTGWLPEKALDQMVNGKALLHKITLREGLAWWEVADLLEEHGFCKAEDFAAIIHNPEFLRHYGIPAANAEGYLFPETYYWPRPEEITPASARSAARRLIETFWRNIDKIYPQGRPGQQEVRRIATLASIVEKETAVPAERPRVAGVYANRLRQNMLLQADPTVAYGLGKDFTPPLLRRHLEDENNPYNSYRKAGLPPGPICSPGLASLRAAQNPEKHQYLYFVAKGTDGSHNFSTNLQDHNRAVQEYRKNTR